MYAVIFLQLLQAPSRRIFMFCLALFFLIILLCFQFIHKAFTNTHTDTHACRHLTLAHTHITTTHAHSRIFYMRSYSYTHDHHARIPYTHARTNTHTNTYTCTQDTHTYTHAILQQPNQRATNTISLYSRYSSRFSIIVSVTLSTSKL